MSSSWRNSSTTDLYSQATFHWFNNSEEILRTARKSDWFYYGFMVDNNVSREIRRLAISGNRAQYRLQKTLRLKKIHYRIKWGSGVQKRALWWRSRNHEFVALLTNPTSRVYNRQSILQECLLSAKLVFSLHISIVKKKARSSMGKMIWPSWTLLLLLNYLASIGSVLGWRPVVTNGVMWRTIFDYVRS